MSLKNKKIIIGVCGSIAAYKSLDLLRELQRAGAQVRVVMTQAAKEFVAPLSFQALSGHPVHSDLLDEHTENSMGHIELARWADLILICPASANMIAKLAYGVADDLLSTLCVATDSPIAIAPAMNTVMWENFKTQRNIQTLKDLDYNFISPIHGEQACGEVGLGKLANIETIFKHVEDYFTPRALEGFNILITLGPTREPIDPVRYISNRSSGKMGIAIAKALHHLGAKVTAVCGPINEKLHKAINAINVETAQQMHDAVFDNINDMDIFISTAAVSDYRPTQQSDQKMKKTNETLTLELIKNPDILSAVALLENKPLCVGFAAETQNIIDYASEKLKSKKLDLIFANDVSEGRAFDVNQNALTLIDSRGLTKEFSLNDKTSLGKLVAQEITRYVTRKDPTNGKSPKSP